MSGIRRTQHVTCPRCGSTGVLELGMALLNQQTEKREFHCATCDETLPMEASRSIVGLKWQPAGVAESVTPQPPAF